MRITIECRRCSRTLHGEVPLGGSPAELVQSFGWWYEPTSTGYICSVCMGGVVQSSIGMQQAKRQVSAL